MNHSFHINSRALQVEGLMAGLVAAVVAPVGAVVAQLIAALSMETSTEESPAVIRVRCAPGGLYQTGLISFKNTKPPTILLGAVFRAQFLSSFGARRVVKPCVQHPTTRH